MLGAHACLGCASGSASCRRSRLVIGKAGRLQPGEWQVAVEIRRLVDVLVVPVEDRGRGRCGWRHDPGPVRWAHPALQLLPRQMLEKAGRLGVMIGDRHPGHAERMQDREVELGHSLVFPQGPVAGRGQAHARCDHRQLIVATAVAEIARSDLRAHVPAVEWRGGVTDAAYLQVHVANRRHGIPPQSEVGEPVKLRMSDRHLKYRVGRQLVERDGRVGLLHEQRQYVEPAARPAAWPAEVEGEAGDVRARWVAGHGALGALVARVPDQLWVEDSRTWPVRRGWRAYGDPRPAPG